MAVDHEWLAKVQELNDLGERKSVEIEGVEVTLPVAKGRKEDQWQRRVSDDILPDSPNADAPEKTPFEILHKLTDPQKAQQTFGVALGPDSEFAPLAPLFLFRTRGKAQIPVAFHVLAVKAADKPVLCRSFTDRTFLLLMRDDKGVLDETLLVRFINHFRARPADLGLAQQTVLELLHPDWEPERDHQFTGNVGSPVKPFTPQAGRLLRRDLQRLLDANLTRSDFFRYTNQLLALHMGLYQPRLCACVNPSMRLLFEELASPESVDPDELANIERGLDPDYRFEGSLEVQAPAGGTWRRMSREAPALLAFKELENRLTDLHFYLMILNRVRDLVETFLRHHGYEPDAAHDLSRRPSDIVRRMQESSDFRRYLERSSEAFCLRFIKNQLAEASHEAALQDVQSARSGLHGLYELYARYNRESVNKPTGTRAHKQGTQVTRRLLGAGESGLLQLRKGFGGYFELGAGLIPLLLMLAIEPHTDKIPVRRLWGEFGLYGINLSHDERESLLARLKAMGLYERYSDAGEANYVRGLLTPAEACA